MAELAGTTAEPNHRRPLPYDASLLLFGLSILAVPHAAIARRGATPFGRGLAGNASGTAPGSHSGSGSVTLLQFDENDEAALAAID
jgi:hypothetical protein